VDTLGISEGDLLTALEEMIAPEGRGVRTMELAKALGVSKTSVRKLLRQLLEEGRLERVRVKMIDLSGRQAQVTGYRLTGGSEGSRAG